MGLASDTRFVIDPFEPVYRSAVEPDELQMLAARVVRELEACRACPRDCGVDRVAGERGVCLTGRHARVSSAFAHMGEEDCLRGHRGSGTIFFGSCNLRCVFCQNADISQEESGRPVTARELAVIMLDLQGMGCHNINFVTPEHVVPQVIEAMAAAVPRGLNLPVVYNTSAYDSLGSLKHLEGLVDIYMPDFKLWEETSAERLLRVGDYPARARAALVEMHRQVGPLRFGPDGIARRGVLIRHLVMPGLVEESAAIFRWLAEEVSPDCYVNIMGQYRPEHRVGTTDRRGGARYTEIDRRPTAKEMSEAYGAARDAGLYRFDERGA